MLGGRLECYAFNLVARQKCLTMNTKALRSFRNFGNYLADLKASHPRRLASSATPLWRSKISHNSKRYGAFRGLPNCSKYWMTDRVVVTRSYSRLWRNWPNSELVHTLQFASDEFYSKRKCDPCIFNSTYEIGLKLLCPREIWDVKAAIRTYQTTCDTSAATSLFMMCFPGV